MVREIEIGSKHKELIKSLYKEYVRNRENYPIEERSCLSIENYICIFCLKPILSGFVKMPYDDGIGKGIYHAHPSCIDHGLGRVIELDFKNS